jgi:hypothetical protein
MAKLNGLFEEFLSRINPDEKAVEYAIDAHEPVRECLEKQDEFKQYVEGSFLYGSYKRYTAVGDIKDVDIVILTNFDIDDEENTPQKVLRKLKDALARCYDDPENPQYQRRSIRIDDPLPDNEEVEMTLDIIPAVVVTGKDEPLRVPDRVVKEWIWSHPKGHLEHTTRLNSDEYGKKRFVPLVKIMKWWWKYQCEVKQPDVERPKPKGFWVECLTGENFGTSQTAWADHFIAVLQSISDKYTDADEVPELQDPGLENNTIKTNMTLKEFEVFMETVNENLGLAILARDASDKLKSSELWREIVGDKFPLYDAEESEETRSASKSLALSDYSHAQPLPWPEQLKKRYKVRLDAYLYSGKRRLSGINSNGRVIFSDLRIKYVARTGARGDYEVFWQVVNTGKHAKEDNGLRGDFFEAKLSDGNQSSNPLVNWEYSRYTGKHWIECFIVKDDVCVGRSGRFYVNIKNLNY